MPRNGTARLVRQLGARLRALRQEAGMTQEKLAWECDLAKPYLSQIEAGKRQPSLEALAALADRLGVQVVDLLASDPTSPTTALLDAVRRRDRKAAREALRVLGLG